MSPSTGALRSKSEDRYNSQTSLRRSDSPEPVTSVQNLLEEEHPRLGMGPFDAEVRDFEIVDDDRRAEILHRLDSMTDTEPEKWLEPEKENASIEVDWQRIRDHEPVEEEVVENLQQKYEKPTGLYRLSVAPEKDVNWQPGDFFSIKLPKTPELDLTGHRIPEVRKPTADNETVYRAYSVASSPNSDTVDFYIKRIPNEAATCSSLTPVLDAKLDEGDEVTMRGPYNDDLSLNHSGRDMVYAATGTGVAPMIGMLEFVFEENLEITRDGEKRDIWMVLGAPYSDEVPAHERLETLEEENENFNYILTLSREEELSGWDGRTGYVQQYLDELHGSELDLGDSEVYVCGGSSMAEGVREKLEDLGVDTKSGFYQEEVF